jgi:hypothetical protein
VGPRGPDRRRGPAPQRHRPDGARAAEARQRGRPVRRPAGDAHDHQRPAINTYASPGLWSNTATDKILGIATARNAINNIDLGYVADTLIINPAQELQLLSTRTCAARCRAR